MESIFNNVFPSDTPTVKRDPDTDILPLIQKALALALEAAKLREQVREKAKEAEKVLTEIAKRKGWPTPAELRKKLKKGAKQPWQKLQ